jgi:pimeloyl-ACP methyl ester carboxylesterase
MSRAFLAAIVAAFAFAVPAGAAAPTAITAPTKILRVDKHQRIAYRTLGTGRPLVMIMGLSGTMDAWDPPFVDALALHHKVVMFDNEGMGRSTLRKGRLTMQRMGDDVARVIRRLKLKKADVLGWSMGGMIAQDFAVRYPKLYRRLVLNATMPGDRGWTTPEPAAFAALSGQGGLAGLLGLLFPPDRPELGPAYAARIAQRKHLTLGRPATTSKQLGAITSWVSGADPAGLKLSQIAKPVLIGAGENDPLVPVDNDRHIAATIPGAQLVTFPDTSHGFLFQEREAWLTQVEAFLG